MTFIKASGQVAMFRELVATYYLEKKTDPELAESNYRKAWLAAFESYSYNHKREYLHHLELISKDAQEKGVSMRECLATRDPGIRPSFPAHMWPEIDIFEPTP